jgi:hypothetical protein
VNERDKRKKREKREKGEGEKEDMILQHEDL